MSKRTFWSVFLPAWRQAFTVENIVSGFSKTGIFPYNSSIILDKIMKKPVNNNSIMLRIPKSCYAVCIAHRVYKFKREELDLSRIFRSYEGLAVQHVIDQHVINGLIEALKHERKRRRRGKRLNLLGEEDSGPQFFSPIKVQAARDFQALKEEDEIIRQ